MCASHLRRLLPDQEPAIGRHQQRLLDAYGEGIFIVLFDRVDIAAMYIAFRAAHSGAVILLTPPLLSY